ncbi:MAG: hypothetical protein IJW24_00500 [Clostridia bacterium]|nr:hypothetical protein [Clostridia bacterium]
MHTFLLIVRIILLVIFVAGIVISMMSKTLAKAKKFGNQKLEDHYAVKTKLIGYIISAAAVAVLLLLSFAN